MTDRDLVHAELTQLLASHDIEQHREHVQSMLAEDLTLSVWDAFRRTRPRGRLDGDAVLVTAGPAGAGKSSAIKELGASLAGHGRIDPDEIKEMLIARLRKSGVFAFCSAYVFSDERPLQPAELSGWVHAASVRIADRELAVATSQGENLIVEGTLTWDGLVGRYSRSFADAGYDSLTVLDVEVPLSTAIEGARRRWWAGRSESVSPAHGGRFVPDDVVASAFEGNISRSARNAIDLFDQAQAEGFDHVRMRRIVRDAEGAETIRDTETDGTRWLLDDVTAIFAPEAPVRASSQDVTGGPSTNCSVCGRPLRSPDSIARGMGRRCAERAS